MLWGGLCADGEEAACRDIHHGEPAVDDWDCRQPPVPGGLPCKGRGLGGYAGGPVAVQGGQVLVYPNKMKFSAPAEQEGYVRRWLEERIGMLPRLDLNFYPGKFSKEKRSILPVGDITQTISVDKADIAVLEEPEHLTWYHHGQRWKNKF